MRVFINTVGSRGDVQPYIALGKGLKAAGHSVTLCTGSDFQSFVAEHGLDYGYLNDELRRFIESDDGRYAMEDTGSLWKRSKVTRKLWQLTAPLCRSCLEESWEAARTANPDVIIFHPQAFGGAQFAELLGVPAILAFYLPLFAPTAEFPAMGFPDWKLGGWYNRLSYRVFRRLTAIAANKYLREWRNKHRLPPRRSGADFLQTHSGESVPMMHGYSRHVVPRPDDWPHNAAVTGYWFLDQKASWEPSAALREFVEAGSPPVYVGFGSIAGTDPPRLAKIVVDALERAGVRGIIATGWGGLSPEELPDTVFMIEEAPHDWLFPRMSAVVHHGGAGTTAAGLRAGRPMVICPFFGDQPFWGRRVRALGVGATPIPQTRLTTECLTSAIIEVTTDERTRDNAEALGLKIRSEDGIANALNFIDSAVNSRRHFVLAQPGIAPIRQ